MVISGRFIVHAPRPRQKIWFWAHVRLRADSTRFSRLPRDLQTAELAELVGATVVGGGDWDGSEACGSPGEVLVD